MEQVIFTCLTPGGSCEWFHLKDFVASFNAIHGTSYYRSKCIDAYGPGNKQPAKALKRPEVMIEAEGEPRVVIERKAVVWPSDFQRDHSKEHYLPSRVGRLLGGEFNDSGYELAFHAEDLKGKKLSQVEKLALQISQIINSNINKAKSVRGIDSRRPVKWTFRRLAQFEMDEPNPATGIRSSVTVSSSGQGFHENPQYRETTLAGFAQRFDRETNRADQKIYDYDDCQRLVVVQFFGESECVTDEDILEIIKASRLPEQIDQVWLTGREWVSLYEDELAWERVR